MLRERGKGQLALFLKEESTRSGLSSAIEISIDNRWGNNAGSLSVPLMPSGVWPPVLTAGREVRPSTVVPAAGLRRLVLSEVTVLEQSEETYLRWMKGVRCEMIVTYPQLQVCRPCQQIVLANAEPICRTGGNAAVQKSKRSTGSAKLNVCLESTSFREALPDTPVAAAYLLP